MWMLVANFLIYGGLNIASGRLRRKLVPISFKSLATDLVAALRGTLGHEALTRYNAVQKFAYLVVIVDIALVIMSGLAVWKSVQFPLLRTLMGGSGNSRVLHFVAIGVLVGFLCVHVLICRLLHLSLLSHLPGP